MLTLFSNLACSANHPNGKEVNEIHGKETTEKIVTPQNDEIRQMGGLNSAGIYTDLASFDRVVLDGLQGLYPLGSDPVSRTGSKDNCSSAKNDIGFPPAQKGAALSAAIGNRLEQEMNSTFGWSINDLIISPTRWLDNRANRQRGTIFATRMMVNFFSTNLAKYGKVDKENEYLKEAREKYFAFTSDKWWFPSSESQYKKGIALLKKYESELIKENAKAVFNLRTDDMYNMLDFIISKQFLDQPLGLLVQSNDDVPYTELDDRIYYTQGIILVLRDVLQTFIHLYPEVAEKGGQENIRIALKDMNQVCTFDPLIVLRGDHDSIMADHRGKMARYLIAIRERINDLAQSIKS